MAGPSLSQALWREFRGRIWLRLSLLLYIETLSTWRRQGAPSSPSLGIAPFPSPWDFPIADFLPPPAMEVREGELFKIQI